MEMYTMDNGRTTNFTERDAICLQMGEDIREIGFKEQCMEGVSTVGLMDKSTKANMYKIRNMDMEAIDGRMVDDILGSGRTTSGMEEAALPTLMELSGKVNGSVTNASVGNKATHKLLLHPANTLSAHLDLLFSYVISLKG
jgi:hypothetical protein